MGVNSFYRGVSLIVLIISVLIVIYRDNLGYSWRKMESNSAGALGQKLLAAIEGQDEESVKSLVQLGADVNTRFDDNRTPLMKAAGSGCGDKTVCLRIIKLLIENGADISAVDYESRTFLSHLVADQTSLTPSQFHDIVTYLISQKLSSMLNDPRYSYTLLTAVKNIEMERRTLTLLQENGVNLKDLGNSFAGDSIIAYALQGGRSLRMITDLIELGVDWRQRNNDNRSLLHIAAQECHPEAVQYFCDKGFDVNELTVKYCPGWTPLHLAVFYHGKKNVLGTVRTLIENGADVMIEDRDGAIPLVLAIRNENMRERGKVIQLLKDKQAEVEKNKQLEKETPAELGHRLFLSIELLDEEAVKNLVQIGADVNVKDRRKQTPLHRAAEKCRVDVEVGFRLIKYLIINGADIFPEDDFKNTFLHVLMESQGVISPSNLHDLVEFLIGRNMSSIFNTPAGSHAITPFQSMVGKLDVETLTLLHKEGTNFNAVNYVGWSVLSSALSSKRGPEFLAQLIEFGADWKRLDDDKESLLHHAARSCLIDEVKYLLSLGLDINAQDSGGHTPLHAAVRSRAYRIWETAQVLIENGADVRIRDNRGDTPYMFAVGRHYFDFTDKDKLLQVLKDGELKTKINWETSFFFT